MNGNDPHSINSTNKLSAFFNNRQTSLYDVIAIVLLLIIWLYTFFDSLVSAVEIWYISEIFNHCFFVIPGALYFIYRKRIELAQQPIKANYILLIPLFCLLVLYALGLAGDVQLFMHVATFASLPLIIWLVIGNRAAKVIAFPLIFMLFSIPVGEELIPWLQQITANISIPLLQYTGIPTFRSGLYVEIPNGKFLIAEACSGISFFIASIVIGALYTYLNIHSTKKKIGFMLIAIVYPIIANALRVYGIILTAYLTDMEYAAGADHIIYGGVFFAIVIISLLFIGELFRDKDSVLHSEPRSSEKSILSSGLIRPSMLTLLILVSFSIWFFSIGQLNRYVKDDSLELSLPTLSYVQESSQMTKWTPDYHDAELQKSNTFVSASDNLLDFFIAYYVPGKGELVSSLNRLYKQDDWTIVKSATKSVSPHEHPYYFEVITNSNGTGRFLASWYVINGQTFADKRKAKLYQILNTMLGRRSDGGVIAISQQFEKGKMAEQEQQFFTDLENNYVGFSNALPADFAVAL